VLVAVAVSVGGTGVLVAVAVSVGGMGVLVAVAVSVGGTGMLVAVAVGVSVGPLTVILPLFVPSLTHTHVDDPIPRQRAVYSYSPAVSGPIVPLYSSLLNLSALYVIVVV
jgi:hypothetical protein